MGYQTVKTIFFVITFGIGAIIGFYMFLPETPFMHAVMQYNDHSFPVLVADTNATRSRGLSGRTALDPYAGMVFVFQHNAVRQFWMKDMRFPLDVLWIRKNEVVGLARGVAPYTPEGEITRFRSEKAVDMVVETYAGFIEQNGLKMGDRIELLTE